MADSTSSTIDATGGQEDGPPLTEDALRAEIAKLTWYHTIDLGNGIVTPGHEPTPLRLPLVRLPKDMRGLTVLDVGAWDGFFSFEAERRGASRVLATDSYVWRRQTWGSKEGFDLARRALGSRVESQEIDVMDLSAERVGVFDIVLCLGVLYHLRHPLFALERLAEVTRRRLIVETHVDLVGMRKPAAVFYPGEELEGDPSNWWGPNPAAVEAMLRVVGFDCVERVSFRWGGRRLLRDDVRTGARNLARSFLGKRDVPPPSILRQGRLVVHAFK